MKVTTLSYLPVCIDFEDTTEKEQVTYRSRNRDKEGPHQWTVYLLQISFFSSSLTESEMDQNQDQRVGDSSH